MISTPGVGCVNSNLCLFRLARTWRDDFVYGSGHGGTWLFWSSRSIQIQFRYSCGPGRARLRHFLLDADTRRIVTLFVSCFMPHTPIMALKMKAVQSNFGQFAKICVAPSG